MTRAKARAYYAYGGNARERAYKPYNPIQRSRLDVVVPDLNRNESLDVKNEWTHKLAPRVGWFAV